MMRKMIVWLAIALFSVFQVSAQQITLKDVIASGTFSPKSVYGLRSMNDGLHYSTLENGGTRLVKYSFKSGNKVADILDISSLGVDSLKRVSDYDFSADETKVLLMTDRKAIYRHSFSAYYYVYNFETKELLPLSVNGRQELATFSPDGERVAFVRENNLFMKSLRFGTERQVTQDGAFNSIINGKPDWVYEEEFSFNKAFEWSPDSKKLAYMKFREADVPTFGMTMFKGERPAYEEYALYPEEYRYKYPKAGETNSEVEVYVYDVKARQSIEVEMGDETDQYIPRIRWTYNGHDLSVFRLNRHQNKLELLFANPNTGDTRPIFTERNDRYIDTDFLDNLKFLPGNKYFVVLSERDGYSHLYLYDFLGVKVRQLTEGEFDVTDFYGYDEVRKLFYYQAAAVSPMQREVYAVRFDKKKKYKLSTMAGTNRAVFSKGFKYFINYFTNLETPNFVSLHDARGKQIRVLEDNQTLKDKLATYALPSTNFFNFITSEGVNLNGYMIKPVDFDETKRYPVLMTQYSGPNSQSVLDRFSVNWYTYLAQEGYLVVCVDPRGTGARGEEFRKCTYQQLGRFESDDQVEAARYLTTLPYVDGENIAIWGWSYGGFMSSLCLAKGADVIKAAIAVAPVTNWRFYDSVYTERYMRTPQENSEGYDDNSPINHVDKIKGKLLLVHGSADDNVHVQNSMEFAEKMVQSGVQFQMMIYTNRNHGISGGNTRMHLYTMFTNFLNDNLR